jgi:hypothetical protein
MKVTKTYMGVNGLMQDAIFQNICQPSNNVSWSQSELNLTTFLINSLPNLAPNNVADGTDPDGDLTGFGGYKGSETLSSSFDWAKNGNRSLKCVCPGNVAEEGVYVIFSNLIIGQKYTFQFTIKAPNNSDMITTFGSASIAYKPNGNPQTYTATFTATGTTHWLNTRTHNSAQAITFYLDEIIITTGSSVYLNPPATRSTMGADLTGKCKWFEGVLGKNGLVYSIPFNAPDILIIDPVNETAIRDTMGLTLVDGTRSGYNGDCSPVNTSEDQSLTRKWLSGVLGVDGKIYCPPFYSQDLLIIDTNTTPATATRDNLGLNFGNSGGYRGAILAPNGKIYCVPYSSGDVLIINTNISPVTAVKTNFGLDLSGSKMWIGGVLAPNGKIYCAPCNSTEVLVIDTNMDNAYLIQTDLDSTKNEFYYDGALGTDGKVYFMPNLSEDILIVDPLTDTFVRDDLGADLTYSYSSHKFTGAVALENGTIMGIPCDSKDILLIDTINQKAYLNTMGIGLNGTLKFRGGVLANGKIFAIPTNSEDILTIDMTISPNIDPKAVVTLQGIKENGDPEIITETILDSISHTPTITTITEYIPSNAGEPSLEQVSGIAETGKIRLNLPMRAQNFEYLKLKRGPDGWSRCRQIPITGSIDGVYSNLVLGPITVPYDSDMKSDFSDVRFMLWNGSQLISLSQGVFSKTNSSTATFYVNIPSLPASPNVTTLYMVYGNPNASSIANMAGILTYWDDFEDGKYTGRTAPYKNWSVTTGTASIISKGALYGSHSLQYTGSGSNLLWNHMMFPETSSSYILRFSFTPKIIGTGTSDPNFYLFDLRWVDSNNYLRIDTLWNGSVQQIRLVKCETGTTTVIATATLKSSKLTTSDYYKFWVKDTGSHISMGISGGSTLISTDYTCSIAKTNKGIGANNSNAGIWDNIMIYPYINNNPDIGSITNEYNIGLFNPDTYNDEDIFVNFSLGGAHPMSIVAKEYLSSEYQTVACPPVPNNSIIQMGPNIDNYQALRWFVELTEGNNVYLRGNWSQFQYDQLD